MIFYSIRTKVESAKGNALLSLFANALKHWKIKDESTILRVEIFASILKPELEYIKHWVLKPKNCSHSCLYRNCNSLAILTLFLFPKLFFWWFDIRAWQPYSLGPGVVWINDFNASNLK
jgi:hypothetical protein